MNYEGREPDAPWRKEALARIDKIRKGNLTVTVKDATGKVVPNAEVKVEMTRHAFKFGSTIPPGFYPGSKVKAWADFAGVADAPEFVKQQYRDHFFRWFNYTHGPAVWGYYKGLEQRITEEDTKEAMRYWHSQGLRLGGGQIVYPRPEFTPAFANKLMKEGKSAEFRQAIKDWIFEAGRTFGPYVESFQIANEFEGSPYYTDVLGGDPYDHIAQWFKWSKEAAPNVRTMINDPGATDAYYERIAEVLKRGGPIELIGLQNHSSFGGPSPSRRLKELDRFAQFKLPIEITEMEVTIRDGSDAEQRAFQGDYFRDQLIAYFSHPAVEGIVLQDFWEGYVWQKDKFPAPMSTDFKTLYPHGKAYENLVLNQWWTREGGKANAKGEYSTRGFFGDYKVRVTANGKTKTVTTLLPRTGQKLEVRLD
jgi:GH35 family endo-1,4-beta-xylanase